MRKILLLATVAGVLSGLPAGGSAATLGEQRVLLILTTWGPEPYAPDHLRGQLDEAAAYIRSSSFGKTWLVGEVTPWLRALRSRPACDTTAIGAAAQSAARAEGYDLTRYSTVGIAMPHLGSCPWGGSYFPPGIWLNGRSDRQVILHELGHTYGVSEEGSAWVCDPRCHAQPYGNPFSVMGHGGSDFGAWEKHAFGWLDRITEPEPRLTIGAIDRASTLPQAVRVVVAGDEYWLEYRPPEPLWEYADDGTAGVVIHAGSNGLGEPSRYPGRNFLLLDPVGRGRPSVQAGERFAVRGAFAVMVVAARPDSAEVAFRWTDRTRPGRPRVLASRPRRGRADIRWRRGIERGSGIAAHEVFVDGRRVGRVPAVEKIGSILVAADDRLAVPLRPGRHRIAVTAIDRAGNRSRCAVRRVSVR